MNEVDVRDRFKKLYDTLSEAREKEEVSSDLWLSFSVCINSLPELEKMVLRYCLIEKALFHEIS